MADVIEEAHKILAALLLPGGAEVPLTPKFDVYICIYFTIVQFVLNWGVRLLIVTPIARLLMGSDAKKSKIDKFAQSAMEFIFYTVFTVIGLSVVPTQRWIWPTANWWNEWETPTVMRDDLKCYYLLYGARYTQAFISVLMEHKRKDFVEMIVHHLTTMIVILASFYGGYYRNGAAIMLLFDPADVPLHAAKLVKYIGFQGLADCFFVLFMLIFFLTRIVIFPYVVWSSHFEANSYFPFGIIESICVGSLYVLAVLNAFWFYLILKVLHGVVTKGKAEDVRSDDEDDDGDDKKKRK